MEKMIISAVAVLVMMSVMAQVVSAMQPPAPTYCCPIEPAVCFYTYDELYQHFITEHPADPITIVWG